MSAGESDLELAWAVLETQERAVDGLRVRSTEVSTPAGDILVSLDGEGRRHLLVPLPDRAAFAADTSTRGVHLNRRRLDTGRGVVEFLDVECRLAHLHAVFVTLSLDMLSAVADTPEQPATACRIVLDRWREFLGSDRSPLLSEEALVGLLAELVVLRDIVAHDSDRRLDVWTGPSGAVHDFRRGLSALEVKGTRVRDGKFVEMHGVEQLVPPPGGTLHLAWVRLDADAAGPLSVPTIADGLRDMGVDTVALMQLLALAGYDPTQAHEYGQRRYRLADSHIYAVEGAFPRIVPASFHGQSLPPGILRVRYTVDLTNEPPYPIGAQITTDVMRRLATG